MMKQFVIWFTVFLMSVLVSNSILPEAIDKELDYYQYGNRKDL